MTRTNIARLVITILVLAAAIFIVLNIEHPAWAKDLAIWQPRGERDIALEYGIDLGTGTDVTLVAKERGLDPALIESTHAIIRARVESLSRANPIVRMTNEDIFYVTMPAGSAHLVTGTLQAEGLVEVVDLGTADPSTLAGTVIETTLGPSTSQDADSTTEPTTSLTPTATTTGTLPVTATEPLTPTTAITPTAEPPPDSPPTPVYETVLTSYDLQPANLVYGPPNQYGFSQARLDVTLNADGANAFYAHLMSNTEQHYLGITVDKKLIAAYPFQSSQISPGFVGPLSFVAFVYGEEARSIRAILNSRPLPIPLTVTQIENSEPTLGADTVRQLGIGAIVGLAAALALLLAYYRFPGLLTGLALAIFGLVGLALCKIVPLPLTLPTITGFVPSMMLALHAHTTLIERLREEMRTGNDLPRVIDSSLSRAWPAIRDTHLALLLVSIAVWATGAATEAGTIHWVGTAMTLGTLASGFVTLAITPLLLHLASNISREWLDERKWLVGF